MWAFAWTVRYSFPCLKVKEFNNISQFFIAFKH